MLILWVLWQEELIAKRAGSAPYRPGIPSRFAGIAGALSLWWGRWCLVLRRNDNSAVRRQLMPPRASRRACIHCCAITCRARRRGYPRACRSRKNPKPARPAMIMANVHIEVGAPAAVWAAPETVMVKGDEAAAA